MNPDPKPAAQVHHIHLDGAGALFVEATERRCAQTLDGRVRRGSGESQYRTGRSCNELGRANPPLDLPNGSTEYSISAIRPLFVHIIGEIQRMGTRRYPRLAPPNGTSSTGSA